MSGLSNWRRLPRGTALPIARLLVGATSIGWCLESSAFATEAPRRRLVPHLETQELWNSTEIPWRLPFHPWLSGQGNARSNPAAAPSTLGPRSFETEEYRTSWFLGKINAAQAYAAGFTGKGVLVAVVDTGVDTAHPEFT